MAWFQRRTGSRSLDTTLSPRDPFQDDLEATRLAMTSALVFGLEARDAALQLADHCARVARMAVRVAEALDVDEVSRAELLAAAQLHEIGLISVPRRLLEDAGRLLPEEVARIRAHARVGAEIVRPTHGDRTAWLVERQYADHAELTRWLSEGHPDLLLAGIFRAADALVAVTHPRPYQRALEGAELERVLLHGAGTRFHPRAVAAALTVYMSEDERAS